MADTVREFNFDGLVGPTHNYAGLSWGNVASTKNQGKVSNPRAAALEGLAKMKLLAGLGVGQGVLPPPVRPDLSVLRRMGFTGSDTKVIETAHREAPQLLAACYSASAMWAANAATVSGSADTSDGRVHFTPANLVSQFHRSIETKETAARLAAIFNGETCFAHHAALPAALATADEGAANHLRLGSVHGSAGVEIFVYGRDDQDAGAMRKYPARQSRAAGEAIARLHGLSPERTLHIQQSAAAVDAGVFHNDVAAVANENVILFHGAAYESPDAIDQIQRAFESLEAGKLFMLRVDEADLTLAEAVETYLFNSQLVTTGPNEMALIAPEECRGHHRAAHVFKRILGENNPIKAVHFMDVRQSMHNGGGPACLRLRVPLNERQQAAVLPGAIFTDALHQRLAEWVNRYYREKLHPDDLADPLLLQETQAAHTALAEILPGA